MKSPSIVRRFVAGGIILLVFAAGIVVGQNRFGQPKSVVHLVSLRWKTEASPDARQKALDGIKTMAEKIPGIKNVWLKTLRVQSPSQDRPFDAVFAIEFADEAAAKAYADHPAHADWEKIYLAVRDESRSFQASN